MTSAQPPKETDQPAVVLLAGGTGSGKTRLAQELLRGLPPGAGLSLSQDSFYRDQSHLDPAARARLNFDHPDQIEWPLLIATVRQLRSGKSARVPVYDFSTHTRTSERELHPVSRLLVVEGTLVLTVPELRAPATLGVFLDAPEWLRLLRRLRRDRRERGRSPAGILQQYLRTVRPMHREWVQPSRRFADLVLDGRRTAAANAAAVREWLEGRDAPGAYG
ncbi:MAG: uridine kinase [Acidobacteriota bacterium]